MNAKYKSCNYNKALRKKKHAFEVERLGAEQNAKPAVQHKGDTPYVSAKVLKIQAFNESKDEMDSVLFRFERYATAQKWKKEDLEIISNALLKLDIYALMPVEEVLNYDMLNVCHKVCLLKQRTHYGLENGSLGFI